MKQLAWLVLAAGCGRIGFSAQTDAPDQGVSVGRPDSAPIPDADPTIDSAMGLGDYSETDTTAPYTLLVSPTELIAPGVVGDEQLFDVSLPFTFAFYGIAYTQVKVSVNGYITFGNTPAGADNFANECPFDSTPPDATIAVFWDDLYAPAVDPPGTIGYAVAGTSPDRTITFEWKDLDALYNAGGSSNLFTQQLFITQAIVLHETGVIELHYGPRKPPATKHDCGLDRHIGCSATVGIKSPGANLSKLVQCGTEAGPQITYAPLVEGRLITFTPN